MARLLDTLAEIAEEHDGVIPASEARALGISSAALVKLASRGRLERLGRGVYRLPLFPSRFATNAELHEALARVAAGKGPAGVISHESALHVWEISDASPASIHITVPPGVRLRRTLPGTYKIHRAVLSDEDIALHEGVRVTSLVRTIRDMIKYDRRDLALSAIDDALRRGHLSPKVARQLRRETVVAAAGVTKS